MMDLPVENSFALFINPSSRHSVWLLWCGCPLNQVLRCGSS